MMKSNTRSNNFINSDNSNNGAPTAEINLNNSLADQQELGDIFSVLACHANQTITVASR